MMMMMILIMIILILILILMLILLLLLLLLLIIIIIMRGRSAGGLVGRVFVGIAPLPQDRRPAFDAAVRECAT